MPEFLILMIKVIPLLVLAMLPFVLYHRWSNRFGASDFDDVHFFEDKIIVFSSIYHSGGDGDSFRDCRISEIDAKSGLVSRRLVPNHSEQLKVLGEIAGKLWISDGAFHVFDPNTFEFVFHQWDIQNMPVGEAEERVSLHQFYLNEKEQRAYFLGDDGYQYSIDPITFTVSRCTFQQEERIVRKHDRAARSNWWMQKVQGVERWELIHDGKQVDSKLTFIRPSIMQTTLTGETVAAESHDGLIILHYDALNPLSEFRFSFVTLKGSVLWLISQKQLQVKHNRDSERGAEIKHVDFRDDRLTIVFHSEKDKMLCIDINSGKILWNVRI